MTGTGSWTHGAGSGRVCRHPLPRLLPQHGQQGQQTLVTGLLPLIGQGQQGQQTMSARPGMLRMLPL